MIMLFATPHLANPEEVSDLGEEGEDAIVVDVEGVGMEVDWDEGVLGGNAGFYLLGGEAIA